MKSELNHIVKHIINDEELSHINIGSQFDENLEGQTSIARNLNASFLILLAGESHPLYGRASLYMKKVQSDPSWSETAAFYMEGLEHIRKEIEEKSKCDPEFSKQLSGLSSELKDRQPQNGKQEKIEAIRKTFFPEGAGLWEKREEKIEALRAQRTVKITDLNESPVNEPSSEILFTSNILLTVPPPSKKIEDLELSPGLKDSIKKVIMEEQRYWYDHPVPMGIEPEHNEILYGLEGLDNAIQFEKDKGLVSKESKFTCVLSVSVTHEGLQQAVKTYIEEELKNEKNIKNLDVYVFTEADTKKLAKEVFSPLACHLKISDSLEPLQEVLGVDGEYGRHYSFLKAIAALWQVFIDDKIKGTFKIDLDQIFPQKELSEQSGMPAFEHFKTPLWGARGVDSRGREVELGMIAGALVNQKDIDKSLFSPDVCFPPEQIRADELIFFSKLPQALSTEAEMMTRYSGDTHNGRNCCIQRIHVTGGTNGILINSLRKHRPFTPTFIGRAEDQAYILSVLFGNGSSELRYVHKDGLIMRHDKEAFAVEAMKMAAAGKLVGDYVRTLMFSYYIKALPWPFADIKKEIDPFTGCFVSRIPLTVVYLRFAIKTALLLSDTRPESERQGMEFFQTGTRRLHETINYLTASPNPLIERFSREKTGWDLFYDILDNSEKLKDKEDPFILAIKESVRSLVKDCKVKFC